MTIHRYGMVSREQVNALTGKWVLESIIAGQLGGRRWHRRVRGCEHLCNPPGIAHGGRTPTLIDSAAGCAGHVAEVHAGTPKSQTLANYPREFWQPSTTD